jgi:hypothetical protein
MNNETQYKKYGELDSPDAPFRTQCAASVRDASIRKERRLKKRHILGGFVVLILLAVVIAACPSVQGATNEHNVLTTNGNGKPYCDDGPGLPDLGGAILNLTPQEAGIFEI